MKDQVFTKERISNYMKVSKEFMSAVEIRIAEGGDDYITGQLTAMMDLYVNSILQDERILTYYCSRPTFFDWLFRREKQVQWKLITKDLLLNPPEENTKRVFIHDLEK